MKDDLSLVQTLGVVAFIGVLVGLGKLLNSDERLSWRLVLGRACVSGTLAVAGAAILVFIPGLSQLALIGLSTAIAVLGEQFLEKLLAQRAGISK